MPPLPPLQHVVLSAYFPNTLTSLHDYLVCRLDDSSRIVDSTADCPAYKGFLHTTLVGEMSPTGESRAAKGAFPRGSAGEVGRKQNEVVNGVIETLFRISEKENGKPSHMLTRGYKKLRLQTMTKGGGHGGLAGASGIKGVENPFPNSLVTQVKSQCWASLLERIGDAAMVYILMHTFIFLALPNGSYCQLTGIQLSELPLPPATQNSTVRIRTGRFKQPILSELTAPRRKGKSKTINASPPEPGKYETDKMSPGDTKSTVEAPKKQKKEEQTVPSSSAETNLGDAMQVGEASRKFKQDEHMTLLSAEINLGHAMQVDEASRKYKQEEHMTLLSSVETNMQVDEVLRKHKQEEKECMTMLSSVETSPGNVMQIEEVSRKHKREEEEQTKSLSSAEALNWIDRPPKKRRAKTAVGWGVKPTNANGKAGTPKSPGPPSKVPFEKLKSRKRKKRKEKQTAPAAGAAGSSEERRGGDEETTQSETSDIAAPSEVAASTDVLMLTGERPKKKVKLVTANEILPSLETSWSVGNSDRGVESESSSGGSQRQKSESDTAIEEAVKSDRALGARNAKKKKANVRANTTEKGKPPSTIQIFRLRMFYARPNYNMAGEILFGLPKIHVLNRYRGTSPTPRSPQPPSVTPSPDIDPIILSAAGSAASGDTNRDATAEHILKYIFPRHFGLENMFVGAAALSPEASSRFVRPKEFLLRTQEIQASKNPIKIHWRMRAIKPLVQRMQMLHSRCQYKNLLMFYCPVKGCNNTVENNWRITRSDTEVDGMQQADASWNGDQNRTNSNDAEILMEVENIANKQHVETDGRVPEADQGNALEPLDDEISPNPIALFSSYHQVSSFVQAILKLVIPRDFWGSDSNRKLTFNAVDRFVRMRKFETISLHEILQGFKVNDCLWLRPRDVSYTDIHSRVQPDTDATVKLTPTSRKAHVRPEEAQKRREMLMEFIYWLFDSFVVPLIKTNFYVTESSPHRNRIFYFRHDLWVKISKPVLDRLMADNFQEVASEEVSSILSQRKLGHSYIRLLPKETGVRPIINLRRKTIMNTSKFNNKSSTPSPWVGSSINMILQNSFHILTFEKSEHPEALGGSVLGMNEIYQRFKTFKQHIYNTSKANEPLYFAKVDITHCFDSIDQAKLLDILQSVVENDEYLLQRYAIMFPSSGKIRKAYIRKAHPTTKFREFPELAHELAQLLRQTVFVDHVVYIYEDRKAVLELLDEHIRMNFVKVGEQYYKQVIGLPQGSCLSMLLCNYFYGDLEKTKLSFVASDTNGMLLRFVDDFLYVSLSKDLVTRFLKAMYKGHPSYGCFINKDKSLVNFDIAIDGIGVPRLEKSLDFPWCGLLLHTKTLDVKADYSRYRGACILVMQILNFGCDFCKHLFLTTMALSFVCCLGFVLYCFFLDVNDAITTENSRHPGEALVHKMMQMLKPKCHPIYINTALNSIFTVLRNIYQNFLLCAMKFHCHARSLPHQDQKFLTGAVFDILNFGYTLLRNRVVSPMSKSFQLECNVKELEVLWLGAHAFFIVLLKKQTSYPIVLRTLEKTLLDKRFNPFRKKLAAVVDRRLSKDFEDILF